MFVYWEWGGGGWLRGAIDGRFGLSFNAIYVITYYWHKYYYPKGKSMKKFGGIWLFGLVLEEPFFPENSATLFAISAKWEKDFLGHLSQCQRGLKYTGHKTFGRRYLVVTHTTMGTAVKTLTQVKARTDVTAILLYSCCWSYCIISQLKYYWRSISRKVQLSSLRRGLLTSVYTVCTLILLRKHDTVNTGERTMVP